MHDSGDSDDSGNSRDSRDDVTANTKLDYTFYIKHHKIKDIKLQNLSTLQVYSMTVNSNSCRKEEKEGG